MQPGSFSHADAVGVGRIGKVFVTAEACGGGTASAKSVAIAARGERNLLLCREPLIPVP